ncbi:DUF2304 domain-containing protein [Blautia obeum]|uniref:DUF2304 domain-containing protein n=1 Tax=Blautia obeum TaxID=40520 RepID=UPI002A84CBEE|nr:DUF2304 domain-containing protein [Lachnospiraceae bacterium]
MNIRIQIIVGIVVVIALLVIVNMIRKKKLELRYALAWLLVGVSILVLDCFPQLITWMAHKLGIASPINMLFFLGFCFSLVIIFTLTVAVSRMSIRIKQLAQEIALFEKEVSIQDSKSKKKSKTYNENDR